MKPAAIMIIIVRKKVAKSELTFSIPTLANIAVNAAKPAESSAQNVQFTRRYFIQNTYPLNYAKNKPPVGVAPRKDQMDSSFPGRPFHRLTTLGRKSKAIEQPRGCLLDCATAIAPSRTPA